MAAGGVRRRGLTPGGDGHQPAAFSPGSVIGTRVPALRLPSVSGSVVDVVGLAERALVLFFLAGPAVSEASSSADVKQCRGYSEHLLELAAVGAKVAGVCAAGIAQLAAVDGHAALPFPLLSDPDMELGSRLGLPTRAVGDRRHRYVRLTVITLAGRVQRVIYPVRSPARDAGEVIQWLVQHH